MKIPKTKQTENEAKRAVKEYLEYSGYTVYRINNAGGYRGKDKQGNPRFSFAGTSGVADLYVTKKGVCPFWVEIKATGKTPAPAQYDFGSDINDTDGTYWLWADSMDMFIRKFNLTFVKYRKEINIESRKTK